MSRSSLSYALVTPARNEAQNLPRLARSLAAQTVAPISWVIVDTGSTDTTLDVARELARQWAWIRVERSGGDDRGIIRGAPVVRGFQRGLETLGRLPDVVVKLDADVSMGEDYFERLLTAFADDERLGIASGSAYELEAGAWRQRHMSGNHVWGASRAYRRECLAGVLPLDESMGWDGIDVLKATMGGWRTRTLVELPFRHHRKEGERDGNRWTAWTAQGRASHYMGYRPWFLILRALLHATREPAALALVLGYAAAALRREPRCADPAVGAFLRRQQRVSALPSRLREALGRG